MGCGWDGWGWGGWVMLVLVLLWAPPGEIDADEHTKRRDLLRTGR